MHTHLEYAHCPYNLEYNVSVLIIPKNSFLWKEQKYTIEFGVYIVGTKKINQDLKGKKGRPIKCHLILNAVVLKIQSTKYYAFFAQNNFHKTG